MITRLLLIVGLVAGLVAPKGYAETRPTSPMRVVGQVSDQDGAPLAGATVIVMQNGLVVSGTASELDGSFQLDISPTGSDSLALRVSSVGYRTTTTFLATDQKPGEVEVTLVRRLVSVGSISVSPEPGRPRRQVTLSQQAIQTEAEASLVPTNPIAALKQPEVSRTGSSHSSQIRVHGTSPVYYLNGYAIGTDPAHYGLFAIIPSSVIDRVSFHPMGSPSRYRLASVVEFKTAQPFNQSPHGEFVLSTIEATGAFSLGGKNHYVLGSLRKSVLDRLVRHVNISTDRVTLPPTNFQDVFGSVGVKLSQDLSLMVDHYQVRDFLSYNTGSVSGTASGINTFQRSQENLLATRLVGTFARSLIEATAAWRTGERQYRAEPSGNEAAGNIQVDISEQYQTGYGRLQAITAVGAHDLTTGLEVEYDQPRRQSMSQHNWNFLPPFSNTDNPYIYQQELNDTYESHASELKTSGRAAYTSWIARIGRWQIETGVRCDYFTPLKEAAVLTGRFGATTRLNSQTQIRFVYGSFSSTPLDNILEPYQILIRANLDQLSPIRTSLISVDASHRGLELSLFHKRLSRLPVLAPDFGATPSGTVGPEDDFLEVSSEGSARFSGGSLSVSATQLGGGPFGIDASYAYTQAYQINHQVVVPHALHSPHRLRIRTDYMPSVRFTLGAELVARSGYPYTPIRSASAEASPETYTDNYYASTLAEENSRRFATNASLNLRVRYDISGVELLVSVANITNRGNPIINASSGQIFDAGIMPMLGLKYKF